MIVAEEIDAKEEKTLLQDWFDTTQWTDQDSGIPDLDPEPDADDGDEGTEKRSVEPINQSTDLTTLDTESLLTELRNREPENPF